MCICDSLVKPGLPGFQDNMKKAETGKAWFTTLYTVCGVKIATHFTLKKAYYRQAYTIYRSDDTVHVNIPLVVSVLCVL